MVRTVILVLALSAPALAQSKAIDVYLRNSDFDEVARQPPGSRDAMALRGLLPVRVPGSFLNYLEAKSYTGLLDSIDASRLNKFVGAAGGSGTTTSLVSKVAVPAVLGLGVEYGSILQQTEGTSTTLRGNLLGITRWALGSDQFPYCPELEQASCSATTQSLRRFSGSTTFEHIPKKDEKVSATTAAGTPALADLFGEDFRMASWGIRFDLTRNQLDDPRYVTKWRDQIRKLRGNKSAEDLTAAVKDIFDASVTSDLYTDWQADTVDALQNAASANDMKVALDRQLELLLPILEKANPNISDNLKNLRRAYSNYFLVRDELLREAQVHKVSLEYVNNHPQSQPHRSALRLIYSHQPTNAPAVITVNLAVTMYHALPTGGTTRLRDLQLAGQLDRRLGEIAGFGQASLALAGYYQWMRDDALITIGPGNIAPGSGIVLPDQAAKLLGTKGHIGVLQAKLSMPMGPTVKIPVSVTWSNRTELIQEKDVRGQIGLTLDVDSLFRR